MNSAAENSNKYQKTRFWKEKSVENVIWFEAYHSIQAWFPFIFGCSKNWYLHCKTMFTCWVSVFCNGPTAQATLVCTIFKCWSFHSNGPVLKSVFFSNFVRFMLDPSTPMGQYWKVWFFSNFVRFVVWQPSPRELNQIERQVREESRKV